MPRFPVPNWISTYSLATPPRSYGANRSGQRKHAGCDLYAPLGSHVIAIAKGKVISVYPFYWKTDAIEIDHKEFGVVRYGEIRPAPGIAAGTVVEEGQVIGAIAQLINPKGGANPHPMLHFELYSGKGSGSLTTTDAPYRRRSDLKDPTRVLHQLWSLEPDTPAAAKPAGSPKPTPSAKRK